MMRVIPENQAGFTLIEVIVVLAILAIILGISAPPMQSWIASARIKADARNLLAEMRKAKTEAIKRKQVVAVAFSTGVGTAGSYRVFIDADGDLLFDVGEETLQMVQMSEGVNLLSADFNGQTSVGFDSRGFAQGNRIGSASLSCGGGTPPYYQIRQTLTGKVNLAVSQTL